VIVPPLAGPRGKRGLPLLHGHGPVIAFPAGGVHGYWHNRADGDWDTWVSEEVIPRVVKRFGIDSQRIAIGGISMGGFGAFDIALHHPGMFCPFRVYDEGFVEAMKAGGADFTAHSWPGAHEGGYWNEHWPDYQRFYVKALAHCG
jgi:pimeloyl-ACP methyl ester carboxylesterase